MCNNALDREALSDRERDTTVVESGAQRDRDRRVLSGPSFHQPVDILHVLLMVALHLQAGALLTSELQESISRVSLLSHPWLLANT